MIRVQKEKKATNYRIRFGHSLWSADQLPAQGVKKRMFSILTREKEKGGVLPLFTGGLFFLERESPFFHA